MSDAKKNALTNTSDRGFKVHFKQYLRHKNEPEEGSLYDGASAELDADLLRTSFYQKRKFRRTARSLRHAS